MNRAEYDELERLRSREHTKYVEDHACNVAVTISGDADMAKDQKLWEEEVEVSNPSDAFVEAFVDGALEVFEEGYDAV